MKVDLNLEAIFDMIANLPNTPIHKGVKNSLELYFQFSNYILLRVSIRVYFLLEDHSK